MHSSSCPQFKIVVETTSIAVAAHTSFLSAITKLTGTLTSQSSFCTPRRSCICLCSCAINHGWKLASTCVDKPIGDLICYSLVKLIVGMQKRKDGLICKFVCRINSCFSSSVGYGCCRCAMNHALNLSVVSLGRLPLLFLCLLSLTSLPSRLP